MIDRLVIAFGGKRLGGRSGHRVIGDILQKQLEEENLEDVCYECGL